MMNDSFWTLPIEFRWYFVFPILLWLWVRSPKWFVAVGCAVSLLALALPWSRDLFFLPAFMLGIVAAHVGLLRSKSLLVAAAAALPVLLLAALWFSRGEGQTDSVNALYYLAAFAFVVAAGQWDSLQASLSVRWLIAVGVASYSIYLVHNPAIGFVEQRGINPILAAIVAVGIGFVFWALFERIFTETAARDRLIGWMSDGFKKLNGGRRYTVAMGARALE
jgi:peptidoglycan/LPS O-acetylase OafA/YrhL